MNSIFSHRFEIQRAKSSHDVLMLFAATPSLDPEEFATVVEDEIERNLVPDELLIVVRDPIFAVTLADLSSDSQNVATLARLRDRATVTLVGYDCTGSETGRTHVAGPAAARVVKFEDFRRRAMTSIFNGRHGFVESTATYHFENPSGRHTERFIRLSNILVRGAEIAFIGFCTLPFVPQETAIAYLDTPSLYAVVAAINDQRASFEDAGPILADNFSSYAGVGTYRFTRIADAVVLISASSSGTLAKELIEDHRFAPDAVTHLLFLGRDRSGSNLVCDLRRDERHNPEGIINPPSVYEASSCRLCASGSHAIKLQGDQFEFAGPQQEPLLIGINDAPPGLGRLMERFAGHRLFGVGIGTATARQTKQFNVAASVLLAHPRFTERLDYVFRRSLPASMGHIVAIDEWSLPFAKQIAAFSDSSAVIIARDNLDAIPAATHTAIVIAASVIESGRSLLDISRDLRSIVPDAPLLYLTGFSKTTGEPRREALGRTLVQTVNPYPYEVIEIERMVLPVSLEGSAWAAELKLLIDPNFADLIPPTLKTVIDARVARLRRSSEPLVDDLFVPNAAGRQLTLQPGFVFWPEGVVGRHSESDVFFTIASVLQQLRANAHRGGKSAIKSNWFQQTILAPENFGRFNDDIIQASILRAAYPFEMNLADTPAASRELGRLINRIVSAAAHNRGGAAAEFLLAIGTERLRLCRADLQYALSGPDTGIEMVEFLRAICHRLTATV